ncbi:nucleotidyltransferase family protein [Paenibacillus sp. 1P07SE]|uniref:nucleotidyltransferase domain-containing protein n=1 Tax=Paenibacillus sp. 1P07SE TaxID=3132209 RepID=UPI0039A47FB4
MIKLLNALYSDNGEPWPDLAQTDLLQEIDQFSMHAQIYHLMMRHPHISKRLPEQVQQSFKRAHDQTAIQNLMLQHTERQILRRFDEHRILAMPLKGTRFAERFFGSIAARATSDVDLLVQPAHLDQAIALITNMGFTLDKILHNHAVLYRPITPTIPLMIELHWTLDKPHLSELRDAPFWESSLPMEGYSGIRELDSQSTFYFMILHGMRHRMDSPRYLVDLAQMLFYHGEAIDLQDLAVRAREDRTLRRVQGALSIVYQQFPRLHDLKPLPFPVMETYWTYEAIYDRKRGKRGLDDYKNRMFFRFGIYDTWKHQILSQQPIYRRLGKRQPEQTTKEIPYG